MKSVSLVQISVKVNFVPFILIPVLTTICVSLLVHSSAVGKTEG